MKRIVAGCILLSMGVAYPQSFNDGTKTLLRVAAGSAQGPRSYHVMNINNIVTWFRADGISNQAPNRGSGWYFPRQTGNVVFADGFMWGGKAYTNSARSTPPTSQPIRVGGTNYLSSGKMLNAGAINGFGSNAVAEDTTGASVRIYRIRRDYASMTDAQLRSDASDYFTIPEGSVTQLQMDSVRQMYDADWKSWPVQKGAPYVERNGIPGYQLPPVFANGFVVDSLILGKYDEPGLAGVDSTKPADQALWTVYNDLRDTVLAGSLPLGIEVQVTMWGYKVGAGADNTVYRRYRMINKGGVEISTGVKGSFWIDSMYVGAWSDPDVGNAGDDLVGCDTGKGLVFAYNGNPTDAIFNPFGLAPPSIGYGLLSGPLIPGNSSDVGTSNFVLRKGVKNLPPASFAYTANGSPYTSPAGTNYNTDTYNWWKLLRGFVPAGSFGFPSPDSLYPSGAYPSSRFPLSGDPATFSGWVDGKGTNISFAPGDRQFLSSVGPFTFAPGETQEIVVALVAGLGADRLSSISTMKQNYAAAATKFASLLPTKTTGVEAAIVPNAFSLQQNYPNPFNPTTAISFHLSANSRVLLTVYDLLGREVATLANGAMAAGTYRVTWDASRFPSGVYFYRLRASQTEGGRAGEFVQTMKMLLTK